MLWLQRASRKSSYAPRNYYSTKSARRNGGIKGCSDSSKFSFWRPVYMDWSVLAGFGITFSVLGVSCQVLLDYSNKHNGLATSRVGLHYLWTYGPTALLTLIASFWSRVECQAKISAPWCRMLEGETTSQQSVLLDYVSQFQPFALYTAVKNKDYSVAASTVASLLLRLTIVVSTSFIVLSPTNIQMKDVEVTLDSQFIDDPSGLSTNGVLAYAALIAMISKNTSLPDGISAEYAYVQAEADVSNILELKTTVDGFEGGLYCSPATLSAVSTTESNPIHLKLESDMCEIGFFEGCFYGESHRNGADVCNSFFIQERECTGPKNTLERAIGVVVSAIVSNYSASPIIGPHHLTDITILQANSFICMPRYQIKPIETVKTSANVKVSALTNATYGRLSSVSPWDIWDAHFDAIPNPANAGMSSTNLLSGELIEFDKLSWLVYLWANRTQSGTPLNYSSLLSGDTILQHFSSYYQQITAILARVSLMKDISAPSTGSAIVSKERLLVQIVPACVMMGLLSLSAAMVIIILWRQPKLLLPHSPNTVIGNAVLLAHNPLRLAEVGSISISDLKTVMNRWLYRIDKVRTNAPNNYQSSFLIDQKRSMHNDMAVREMKTSNYRPLSLSVAFRLFAVVLIISVVTTLEVLLRRSWRNDGIADAPIERSKYQLWTIFPGLLSALISMYTVAVDADVRSQSPLLRLRCGAAFDALSFDLVDRHISAVIVEELRYRSFESLASTFSVTISSLLAIFSASLFFATTSPAQTAVQLKTTNGIYHIPRLDDPDDASFSGWTTDQVVPDSTTLMILLKNASYPAFTYQDLVYPKLVLDGAPPSYVAQSTTIYRVTIPAIRPNLTNCELFNHSQICTVVSTPTIGPSRLEISVKPKADCGLPGGAVDTWVTEAPHGPTYFGLYSGAQFANGYRYAGHGWVWGSWTNDSSDDSKAGFESMHALICNDTLTAVETSAEFNAETMTINNYDLPAGGYANAFSLTSMEPVWVFDPYLLMPFGQPVGGSNSSFGLDGFFTIITSSRYAIPAAYLGDPSMVSAVVESIQFHHRIFLVQILDQRWRNDNITSTYNHDHTFSLPNTVYNATARDPSGRNRVIQDTVSTRILQSLLAAILVCLGVNWFLMRNINIVPRSPTSIANWMALLADGNLGDFLPQNTGLMSLDDISRWYFGQDAVFYLGFRKSPASGKEVLGIYVVSQHSGVEKPMKHVSSWRQRLWAFVPFKIKDNKKYVYQRAAAAE